MSSVLAVLAQIALSASNYAVFVALSRLLDESAFVAFSTAVGLNMLAYAVAEGGVSYIAPKALAERGDHEAAALAGSFIAISGALYLAMMGIGFFAWNLLAREPLHGGWVLAYAVFFVPALAMPAWLTARAIDRAALLVIVLVRAGLVALVCFWPAPVAFWIGGLVFAAQVAWLQARANRARPTVALPERSALRAALGGLRHVFVARTASYTVYAMLPLVVGVLRGNAAASQYVTAERLKSLYATLFQPLVQSLYLWQFQRGGSPAMRRAGAVALQGLNVATCLLLLLASSQGWLHGLGERLAGVPEPHALWLAAAFSVATAGLLHLHVFPQGAYDLFRRASVLQMGAFVALAVALALQPQLSPQWLLFGGELVLLVGVVGLLAWRRVNR